MVVITFAIVSSLLLIATTIAGGMIYRQKKRLESHNKELTKTLSASRRIYRIILEDLDLKTVIQRIADTIPNELEFGTGVVAILDEKKGVLKRVGASRTKEAQEAIKALSIPFDQIHIPITDLNNLMARALHDKKSYATKCVSDVMTPIVSKAEADKLQQIMGTKTTLVYPIFLKEKPIGVFLASTKKEQQDISPYELYIIDDFVNLVGLVLQNSNLYTSLRETKETLVKANEVISQVNRQLKDLDKLKDDFVSVASHELRTPMTAIRSYAWMALNRADIPLSAKMKKYLQRTLSSTERLINLVNEMLNISRIESGRIEINPEVFDIHTLLDEVSDEIAVKAKEKSVTISIQKEQTPNVYADQNKIHQILLNLVGNAMKFTPVNGTIKINTFSDGKTVEVSVVDNGVGISPADASKLFTKFGRLDSSYVAAATSGGTGLGLYICKSLIELMGGKIWARSEGSGKGSTFTFSIPTASGVNSAKAYQLMQKRGGAKGLEPVAI